MGSGFLSISNIFWSIPSYMRCNMGSCSAFPLATGKYSSMREIPSSPMFCVISTALVLHGVIISLRGPTNQPSRQVSASNCARPKSQLSFSTSRADNSCITSTAIICCSGVLKKSTILYCFMCVWSEKSYKTKRLFVRKCNEKRRVIKE